MFYLLSASSSSCSDIILCAAMDRTEVNCPLGLKKCCESEKEHELDFMNINC